MGKDEFKKIVLKRLGIVICLFFVLLTTYVIGQVKDKRVIDEINVSTDSVVQLGQKVCVKYVYNTLDSTDRLISPLLDLDKKNNEYFIIEGPTRSYSVSTSLINGTISRKYGEEIAYTLCFNKEGSFSLPPMKARTTLGRNLISKPFSIRVTMDCVESVAKTNELSKSQNKDVLLTIEATVNRNHVCLGDSIECDIRLYFNRVINRIIASPFSAESACWKECMLPGENAVEAVEYNGNSVSSILLNKFKVVPLQTGKVVIEPMEITTTYQMPNPSFSGSFFDAFLNGVDITIERDTVIRTNRIEVSVEGRKQTVNQTEYVKRVIEQSYDWGLVIDRSSSLLLKADSLALSYMDLENLFLEQLFVAKELSQPFISFFAGKPHYPSPSELANIIDVMPSKQNDGSAVYDAVLANALGQGALTSDHSPYSILLLTDGSDNASRISESTLKNLMLQNKIRVDVIAFGSKNDSLYREYDSPLGGTVGAMIKNNRTFSDVEKIANATNGVFVLIEDNKQIPEVISRVRDMILYVQPPFQKPDHDFHPDNELLNRLYEGIIIDSETVF